MKIFYNERGIQHRIFNCSSITFSFTSENFPKRLRKKHLTLDSSKRYGAHKFCGDCT